MATGLTKPSSSHAANQSARSGGDGVDLIGTVGIVEVDVIGLQAFQGAVDGGADVGGILSLVIGMIADLRGDDDVVAVAAGGQPGADDGLGFAAGLPRQPRRV